MVNTGVPFMLYDRTGSLSGSEFNDVHDRISLHVRCMLRDPDGTSQYGVYNPQLNFDMPVVTFEYGAGGALGNITMFGSGGSLRTQAISAFLVEAGGYVDANANSPRPLLFFLHTSTHAMFLPTHRPRHRKFTASDGHRYSWSWRTSNDKDLEWSVSIFTNV
jgi:hypothetical protein